ncbi:MAG: phosphoribosyltransferase [Candidatus Acidiferrales bacterium]
MRVAYSAPRLSARVSQMGRAISRDYAGRTVHVVAILENSFLFAADLVRKIRPPVVCHFVRSETRDVKLGGFARREVYFSSPPSLRGHDVLVVDAILHSGVTQDFLLRRLEETQPRTLRLAVLFDKTEGRKVDIRPAYTGFAAASKYWVGYGLPGRGGLYRNLSFVGVDVPREKHSRRRRRQKGS